MFKIHNIFGGIMIKYFYRLLIDNKIPTLAASLSFNIILNGGSFLFLYLIMSRYFDNSILNQFINSVEDSKLKDLIVYFIDYQNNINYSFFLVITSIYSASSLYYHLINVLELLTKRSYKVNLSRRIVSIILTVLFLVVINIIIMFLFEIIRSFKIGFIILVLLVTSLILYLVNMVCLKEMNFKKIYKGFIFSLLYFLLFTISFILYLRVYSNFKVIYGVLSFMFIFCFYIYSNCIGFLIGICINVKNNSII